MKHRGHLLLMFGTAAALCALAQSSAPVSAPSQTGLDPTPSRTTNLGAAFYPSWSHHSWQDNSLIVTRSHAQGGVAAALFDAEGRTLREARLDIRGAKDSSVFSGAVLPNGILAVTIGAIDSEGRIANFIGIADSGGTIRPLIRTNPFVPIAICAADDNTVWAYGWERGPGNRESGSYKLVHQYDLQKGEIQAAVDRALLHVTAPDAEDVAMQCKGPTFSLFVPGSGQLFMFDETSPSNSVGSWEASITPNKSEVTGATITKAGEVFATVIRGQSGITELFHLQRDDKQARWVPVGSNAALAKGLVELLGSDGNDLIFLKRPEMRTEWRHLSP